MDRKSKIKSLRGKYRDQLHSTERAARLAAAFPVGIVLVIIVLVLIPQALAVMVIASLFDWIHGGAR